MFNEFDYQLFEWSKTSEYPFVYVVLNIHF